MTLDELLKQNAAWLDKALKQPIFDKADEKTVNFPEEQRQRRIAELRTRISDLAQRKDEMSAAYDRAIALDQQELKSLSDQAPPSTNIPIPSQPTPNQPQRDPATPSPTAPTTDKTTTRKTKNGNGNS
jgi:hypothetical protein